MRKFTLRKNGQMMTTFRVRYDLSQAQIDDLISRSRKAFGELKPIEEILSEFLMAGYERLVLDASLDTQEEEA